MFRDRVEAGRKLTQKIKAERPELSGSHKALVLGIPRGGTVVAVEIARELRLPLDVVIVRKLGVPGHEELAFGAVDPNGEVVLNREIVGSLGLRSEEIERVKERELAEAKRREEKFRYGRGPLDLSGRIIILVDDGIATGATTEAAINYVQSFRPREIILAVPVIAADTLDELNSKFQITNPKQIQNLKSKISITYLESPVYFAAVGQFYQDFPQTTDEEVVSLLRE